MDGFNLHIANRNKFKFWIFAPNHVGYVGCMTFWPLSLPLLSPWCFIISPRLILIPCRMPFEWFLCHFVGEWELFFEIHVHFKKLYVFGTKLVTMATIVKGYWPSSVIIWDVFTPTLWTFFGHSHIYFQLNNVYFNVYNCMFGSDLCTISNLNVVPCTRVLHDLLTLFFNNNIYVFLFHQSKTNTNPI